MLWIALLLAVALGAYGAGWHSLHLARQGSLAEATKALKRASVIAGLCGMGLTVPTLGWPFKQVTVSVTEEVTRTVTETVVVPVQVTRWLFWKTTRMETREETREIPETRTRLETAREFSFWLLIPMAGVGWLCYLVEKWTVLLAWRLFG